MDFKNFFDIFCENDNGILNDLMSFTLSFKKNKQETVFSKVGRMVYNTVS